MSDRATTIVRAATELDRELQELRAADQRRLDALHEWRDKATAAEAALAKAKGEAAVIRADLEALQAAVRGITGKEGTVAQMVADLAEIERSNDARRRQG